MLSTVRVSTAQAKDYYSKDDYYLETAGTWQGELAKDLGFVGKVREDDFHQLIEGNDPKGRFNIKLGGVENKHTAGVDCTFSAPKSVSIAALILEDKQIIEAHNQAVEKALSYIEEHYTNVREKIDGVVHTNHTGNMIAAKFQHVSSRELDPQLHTHCLVMNVTKTIDAKGNERFLAMDYKDVFDTKMLMGQIYRSELAANLKDLGYSIESDGKGLFEIKGIDKEVIKEFSKRSEQIKERYEELKKEFPYKTKGELKAQATLETRKAKDEPSMDELKIQWQERISELGVTPDKIYNKDAISDLNKSVLSHEEVIDKTMKIVTDTDAVVPKEDVLRVSCRLSMGDYRVDDIQKSLDSSDAVIQLERGKQFTTPEIVAMERKIVNIVEEGKGKIDNVLAKDDIYAKTILYEIAKSEEANISRSLTQGQRNAVEHILSSKDKIIAIQGDAGTGKTTMLDCVRSINDQSDIKMEIIGLSVTGKAASEIEEASRIKSSTIAGMIGRGENLHGKMVIIDEASMLSIRDMNTILSRCDEHTKVVLIGDTKQLQTVGQGKIFTSLQEKNIISTVRMAETIRQSGSPEYKDIVDTLGNKDIVAAYQKLEEQGSIIEVKDRDRRLNGIVKQYLEKPRETIIVTASNRDREDLNNLIRSSLVNDKKVSNDSLDVITRENVRLTSTERYFTDSYNITDVLVANKDGILGDAGSEARIMGVDESNHTLLVSTNNGQVVVDVKEHGGDLQVYKEQHRQFASGDKIIFLKNDKQLEVKNGQTAIIQSIDLESRNIVAKMDNGSLVTLNPDKQYKYLGHGYAITDYKSQGQTEKHVIYHADTNKKVTFNQAYVGITRGKQSVTIYTNDSEHLKESMQKDQVKTSTLDYKIPADIRKINNEYSNKLNKDSVAHTNTRSIEKPKENIAQRTIDRSQGMER